jgi:type VI secretion system ImpB/VipA family protein
MIARDPMIHFRHDDDELPLRILVVGEFTAGSNHPLYRRRAMPVEPDTFAAVMAAHRAEVEASVRNHLTDGSPTRVWLQLRDLYDLLPEGIAVQMPALAAACKRRDALLRLRAVSGRQLVEDALRSDATRPRLIHELGPAPADLVAYLLDEGSALPRWIEYSQLDAAFDQLRDQLDLRDRDALLALVALLWSLLADPTPPGEDRESSPVHILRIIKEIDRRINAQLNTLLHAPEVQRLETAWRSLKYLVDTIDFEARIAVDILDASKPALLEDLRSCSLSVEDAALFKILRFKSTPYNLVCSAHTFDPVGEDLEILAGMAAICERTLVPLLTNASPALLDLPGFAGLASLTAAPQTSATAPRYAEWRAFQARSSARFVALCLPRFLLRAPYGEHDDDFRTLFIRFREYTGDHEDPRLWGPAALTLASQVADAFARNRRTRAISPLEARPSQALALALAELGLVALVASPEQPLPTAARAATLHDILLLSRLAGRLSQLHPGVLSDPSVAANLEANVNEWLEQHASRRRAATVSFLPPTSRQDSYTAFRLTITAGAANGEQQELHFDGRIP